MPFQYRKRDELDAKPVADTVISWLAAPDGGASVIDGMTVKLPVLVVVPSLTSRVPAPPAVSFGTVAEQVKAALCVLLDVVQVEGLVTQAAVLPLPVRLMVMVALVAQWLPVTDRTVPTGPVQVVVLEQLAPVDVVLNEKLGCAAASAAGVLTIIVPIQPASASTAASSVLDIELQRTPAGSVEVKLSDSF